MKTKQKIFMLAIVIIALFGYLDSQQIIPWQLSQSWCMYDKYVGPSIFNMWVVALGAIAFMYYILKKDKSEAVGVFVTSWLLLVSGLEDLWFFILSNNSMPSQMCWFSGTQALTSNLLGLECVTPITLILNIILFGFISWKLLDWFFKQKW